MQRPQKKRKRMPPSRRTGSYPVGQVTTQNGTAGACRAAGERQQRRRQPGIAKYGPSRNFHGKSPPIGSACPARKCARQVGCSFVMNCFDCTGSCPVCKGAVRGKICPMTALGKFFCAESLLFAREYGNIIRQYRVILRFIMYALVAQPVEHLTFNQRARDSSSLERTKEKAMIHRSKDGLNRGFSFCFIELFWPDFATFLRQIQKCESKSRGQ